MSLAFQSALGVMPDADWCDSHSAFANGVLLASLAQEKKQHKQVYADWLSTTKASIELTPVEKADITSYKAKLGDAKPVRDIEMLITVSELEPRACLCIAHLSGSSLH